MVEVMEETKKDKIIRKAQQNPFMKIEDLADEIGTTKSYVRTILSEAGISLTKLRKETHEKLKEKYEKMERQA